jgi:uncharacterized protein (TIGR02145 family)
VAGGSSTVGTKLKSASGWDNNGNGTDDYGFSALPGGSRITDGSFDYAGYTGNWWTATEAGSGIAHSRRMSYSYGSVYGNNYNKSYGWSVRCVGD